MLLSPLQRYILKTCYQAKTIKVNRSGFLVFYSKNNSKTNKQYQTDIITNSLERLIDRGLLVGFGQRTAKKWFIKEVKLTSSGKKEAKNLFGRQQKLKF